MNSFRVSLFGIPKLICWRKIELLKRKTSAWIIDNRIDTLLFVMAPLGNVKFSSSKEKKDQDPQDDIQDDCEAEESSDVTNSDSSREGQEDSENKSDTSDPIVVSPIRTPPASPVGFFEEKEGDDKIANAKVAPKIPAIPSFISAGLQRKATPFAINSWTALALTLDGRDKITKVFQYLSRFLGWWLAGGSHKNQSIRFIALYKSFATSRKAFRMGRSFMELEKIRKIGLLGLIFSHVRNQLEGEDGDREEEGRPKSSGQQASSNPDWEPVSNNEEGESSPSLVRSWSNVAYRKVYRPLLSRLFTAFASTEKPSEELWRAFGSVVKMFGLLGFWAGDNVNFLCSSGAFDNYNLPHKERLARRKKIQSLASTRANQAYFVGAMAGLLTNWYAYHLFRRENLAKTERRTEETTEEDQERSIQQFKLDEQKQFSLVLALLKVSSSGTSFSRIDFFNLFLIFFIVAHFRAAAMLLYLAIMLALTCTRNLGGRRTMKGFIACVV